ncbi:MAG: hypothetical protein ACXAAH_07890 [Promethearchaeota archaeon]|jgi:hypothetical protein
MDWIDIVNNLNLWHNEFVNWYLVQPIYGQILVIIGIIAIVSLIITLVYYIIKGTAYLIYYILKGIYYLLKGIGFGIFKLSEGFYYLVSGEKKPKNQTNGNIPKPNIVFTENILFCRECGTKLSDKIINQMLSNNIAYCVNCGTGLKVVEYQKPLLPTH